MLHSFLLFAQEVAEKQAEKQAEPSPFASPIMLLPVFALFYIFLIMIPNQRRQRKEAEALMSGMKKNDEVVTASGIIGIVAHIKEGGDEVTLKIDDNARIRVLKSSIVRIVKKEEPKDAAAPAAANTTGIKPA